MNTEKRTHAFSIMSDFDKVFEQVWNVNLFSNDSADVMKVLEQTEEIMNDDSANALRNFVVVLTLFLRKNAEITLKPRCNYVV